MSEERRQINLYGKPYNLSITNYQSDPVAMAIVMEDPEAHEQERIMSVNLGSYIGNGSFVQKNTTYLDVNKLPGIGEEVQKAGLAQPYTRFGMPVTQQPGFVEYPLYEFNEDLLRQCDPEGYDKYVEGWQKGVKELQSQMFNDMFNLPEGEDEDSYDNDDEINALREDIAGIEADDSLAEGEKQSMIGDIESDIEKLKALNGYDKNAIEQDTEQDAGEPVFERITDKRGKERIKTEVNGQTVAFAANYGNHQFTDDEVKSMLQGEEITIPDFQTKSGKVMDITGKLDTGKYMGREYFGFQRTDIQKERSLPTISDSVEAQSESQFE